MSWRILFFSNPCRLNIKNSQIHCELQDNVIQNIPLEDISVIVLESRQISLTSVLIAECAKNNVVIFSCDSSHMPCGVYLPFNQHSRFTQTANSQLKWDIPFKNRLWQKIIRQKIFNQAALLKKYGLKNYETLMGAYQRVQSGDKTNCEAFAAKVYWENIFENFQRNKDEEDLRNSALNYGYAIVRGAVARALSASGFIMCYGIHHNSELNAFNLADDIMEPFRPFVDKVVYKIFIKHIDTKRLDKEMKQSLIGVLLEECFFKGKKSSVLTALQQTVETLMTASRETDAEKLMMPEF